MANIEDAVATLELILREDYPVILTTIMAEKNDGIKLEPIMSFEWEEVPDALKSTPTCLIVGNEEIDPELSDRMLDARVILFIVLTDRSKTFLTKKLYRYAEAVRRVLRPAANRTLRGKVVSAKVERVSYSPTFVDRDNLFARDLQMEIVVRVPRSDC